jgi:hypothetical protein
MTRAELRATAVGVHLAHRTGGLHAALARIGVADWPQDAADDGAWTRERVLAEIRRRDRDSASLHISELSIGLRAAAIADFGTWRNAIVEARTGHPAVRRDGAVMSPESVLAEIRASARAGRVGIGPDGLVTAQLAEHARCHFGSLPAAIRAAGLEPAHVLPRRVRGDDDIIAELQKLARTSPAMTVTELHRTPIGQLAGSRYGSLAAALEAAELQK